MQKAPLPSLPGYRFADPKQQRFPVTSTFDARNGYVIPKPSSAAGEPLPAEDLDKLSLTGLQLTYRTTTGETTARGAPPTVLPPHVPAHVALDKKVLTFHGYFKETVHESPDEYFRVRHVKIFYYLEDDTMSVLEPETANSGLPQGKLIRRQRLPKDTSGINTYSWKDLNVAMNITIYGKVFRITKCDAFTKNFLESNGIEINEAEEAPVDPYSIVRRKIEQPCTLATAPSDFDKLRQFLTLDRKVLRFYTVWDDRDSMYGEKRHFTLLYFLVDDTIEIRERHAPNNGRDSFPILLRRQKVPRNYRAAIPPNFPSVVLELSEEELNDVLAPEHFGIGATVNVLGRQFLLYDCDDFTKEFYRRNFNVTDFTPVPVADPVAPAPTAKIPPHTGFGSFEDSMQSVLSLMPKPPKTDVSKLLTYDNEALRFTATLETDVETDRDRRFVLSYFLASDTITIYETKSSHTTGRRFLEASKITHPASTEESIRYYSDSDLYPGARLQIHARTFVLGDCDAFVAKYAKAHPERYSEEATKAILEKHAGVSTEGSTDEIKKQIKAVVGVNSQAVTAVRKALERLDSSRIGVLEAGKIVDAIIQSAPAISSTLAEKIVAAAAMGDGTADYHQCLALLQK